MRKRLMPIGNSYGIILERNILKLLGFDRQTEFAVEMQGERIVLTPQPRTITTPPPGADEESSVQAAPLQESA